MRLHTVKSTTATQPRRSIVIHPLTPGNLGSAAIHGWVDVPSLDLRSKPDHVVKGPGTLAFYTAVVILHCLTRQLK